MPKICTIAPCCVCAKWSSPAASDAYEPAVRVRIVAVPITELAGNYALVIGRPLQPTNDILSSLWLVLIIFGASGVIMAAVVGFAKAGGPGDHQRMKTVWMLTCLALTVMPVRADESAALRGSMLPSAHGLRAELRRSASHGFGG